MNKTGQSKTETTAVTPKGLLLPYQRRWVDDSARFKIGLMARQTGKSFACAGEAVEDALRTPRTLWVVLSAGERQALEFMRKAREWAEAYQYAIEEYAESRDYAEAMLKSAEITWSNKSRMIAVPANPDTARGYSANLILDEFAFHEKPSAIWRSIYPSISNPLKGTKKLRIVSTPNGQANKFYDLWTKNTNYSHHKVTIHDAVAQGLPVNIEELRAGLDDPDGWAQEFECQFIDAGGVMFPYELLGSCERQECFEVVPAGFRFEGPLYVGIDVGTVGNPTVCWTFERLNGVLWTREVLALKGDLTPQYANHLRERMARAAGVCIDATGLGTQLGQDAVREFGDKVRAEKFSLEFKKTIFGGYKRALEDRLALLPVSRECREDHHCVKMAGDRIVLEHKDGGHADRAVAAALAHHAAGIQPCGMIVPFTRGGGRTAARRERCVEA